MIGHSQHVAVQRVKLEELVVGESLGRDPQKVMRLYQLLLDHPDGDLEPMLVKPKPGGYVIENGHHRFLAYLLAGRTHALCNVVRKTYAPAGSSGNPETV